MDTITSIDDEIKCFLNNDISFNDLSTIAYNIQQNSRMFELDKEIFINNCCTVDGDIVTLTTNGKTYKYDTKKHIFYSGNESFEAYFYAPSGASDYSKLNTYTCFVENSSNYKNLMSERYSNSMVVKIIKEGNSNFNKYSLTADATRFMNTVANTDLDSGNCRNVIGGDSVYGTHSLKIVAANSDLYQIVYCVNNAVIVTNKNGIKGDKTQFSSLEELSKLDGKDIYFISVTGDHNLSYGTGNGSGWVDLGTKYEKGYVYTGLNIICDTCPNANIHMVYDEAQASSVQGKLVNLLKGLEDQYSNYSYDSAYWSAFADKEYLYHSQGNIIVNDLANSGVTNYNVYNS